MASEPNSYQYRDAVEPWFAHGIATWDGPRGNGAAPQDTSSFGSIRQGLSDTWGFLTSGFRGSILAGAFAREEDHFYPEAFWPGLAYSFGHLMGFLGDLELMRMGEFALAKGIGKTPIKNVVSWNRTSSGWWNSMSTAQRRGAINTRLLDVVRAPAGGVSTKHGASQFLNTLRGVSKLPPIPRESLAELYASRATRDGMLEAGVGEYKIVAGPLLDSLVFGSEIGVRDIASELITTSHYGVRDKEGNIIIRPEALTFGDYAKIGLLGAQAMLPDEPLRLLQTPFIRGFVQGPMLSGGSALARTMASSFVGHSLGHIVGEAAFFGVLEGMDSFGTPDFNRRFLTGATLGTLMSLGGPMSKRIRGAAPEREMTMEEIIEAFNEHANKKEKLQRLDPDDIPDRRERVVWDNKLDKPLEVAVSDLIVAREQMSEQGQRLVDTLFRAQPEFREIGDKIVAGDVSLADWELLRQIRSKVLSLEGSEAAKEIKMEFMGPIKVDGTRVASMIWRQKTVKESKEGKTIEWRMTDLPSNDLLMRVHTRRYKDKKIPMVETTVETADGRFIKVGAEKEKKPLKKGEKVSVPRDLQPFHSMFIPDDVQHKVEKIAEAEMARRESTDLNENAQEVGFAIKGVLERGFTRFNNQADSPVRFGKGGPTGDMQQVMDHYLRGGSITDPRAAFVKFIIDSTGNKPENAPKSSFVKFISEMGKLQKDVANDMFDAFRFPDRYSLPEIRNYVAKSLDLNAPHQIVEAHKAQVLERMNAMESPQERARLYKKEIKGSLDRGDFDLWVDSMVHDIDNTYSHMEVLHKVFGAKNLTKARDLYAKLASARALDLVENSSPDRSMLISDEIRDLDVKLDFLADTIEPYILRRLENKEGPLLESWDADMRAFLEGVDSTSMFNPFGVNLSTTEALAVYRDKFQGNLDKLISKGLPMDNLIHTVEATAAGRTVDAIRGQYIDFIFHLLGTASKSDAWRLRTLLGNAFGRGQWSEATVIRAAHEMTVWTNLQLLGRSKGQLILKYGSGLNRIVDKFTKAWRKAADHLLHRSLTRKERYKQTYGDVTDPETGKTKKVTMGFKEVQLPTNDIFNRYFAGLTISPEQAALHKLVFKRLANPEFTAEDFFKGLRRIADMSSPLYETHKVELHDIAATSSERASTGSDPKRILVNRWMDSNQKDYGGKDKDSLDFYLASLERAGLDQGATDLLQLVSVLPNLGGFYTEESTLFGVGGNRAAFAPTVHLGTEQGKLRILEGKKYDNVRRRAETIGRIRLGIEWSKQLTIGDFIMYSSGKKRLSRDIWMVINHRPDEFANKMIYDLIRVGKGPSSGARDVMDPETRAKTYSVWSSRPSLDTGFIESMRNRFRQESSLTITEPKGNYPWREWVTKVARQSLNQNKDPALIARAYLDHGVKPVGWGGVKDRPIPWAEIFHILTDGANWSGLIEAERANLPQAESGKPPKVAESTTRPIKEVYRWWPTSEKTSVEVLRWAEVREGGERGELPMTKETKKSIMSDGADPIVLLSDAQLGKFKGEGIYTHGKDRFLVRLIGRFSPRDFDVVTRVRQAMTQSELPNAGILTSAAQAQMLEQLLSTPRGAMFTYLDIRPINEQGHMISPTMPKWEEGALYTGTRLGPSKTPSSIIQSSSRGRGATFPEMELKPDGTWDLIDPPPSKESPAPPVETITNHSGGALGADSMFDTVGREFGQTQHKHYYHGRKTSKGNTPLTDAQVQEGIVHAKAAAKVLGRPWNDRWASLLGRNWYQIKNSTQVIAIAPIVKPGEKNSKGYVVKAKKETVDGGTGYAVEMAIANGKEVNVFNLRDNKWYKWNGEKFAPSTVPLLHKNFAGIGARQEAGKMTPASVQAIRDVYEKATKPSFPKEGLEEGPKEHLQRFDDLDGERSRRFARLTASFIREHRLTNVEEALSHFLDDRSHGNDAMAEIARHVYEDMFGKITPGLPLPSTAYKHSLDAFVKEVLEDLRIDQRLEAKDFFTRPGSAGAPYPSRAEQFIKMLSFTNVKEARDWFHKMDPKLLGRLSDGVLKQMFEDINVEAEALIDPYPALLEFVTNVLETESAALFNREEIQYRQMERDLRELNEPRQYENIDEDRIFEYDDATDRMVKDMLETISDAMYYFNDIGMHGKNEFRYEIAKRVHEDMFGPFDPAEGSERPLKVVHEFVKRVLDALNADKRFEGDGLGPPGQDPLGPSGPLEEMLQRAPRGRRGKKLVEYPKVARQIIERLKEHFPWINGKQLDAVFAKNGEEVAGRAIGTLVEWSKKGNLDTPPHEFAHVIVDLMKNHPLVKEAIKFSGGEEKLVQRMGEFYAREIQDSSVRGRLASWLKKFWLELKNIFGNLSAEDTSDLVSHRFFRGEVLKGRAGVARINREAFIAGVADKMLETLGSDRYISSVKHIVPETAKELSFTQYKGESLKEDGIVQELIVGGVTAESAPEVGAALERLGLRAFAMSLGQSDILVRSKDHYTEPMHEIASGLWSNSSWSLLDSKIGAQGGKDKVMDALHDTLNRMYVGGKIIREAKRILIPEPTMNSLRRADALYEIGKMIRETGVPTMETFLKNIEFSTRHVPESLLAELFTSPSRKSINTLLSSGNVEDVKRLKIPKVALGALRETLARVEDALAGWRVPEAVEDWQVPERPALTIQLLKLDKGHGKFNYGVAAYMRDYHPETLSLFPDFLTVVNPESGRMNSRIGLTRSFGLGELIRMTDAGKERITGKNRKHDHQDNEARHLWSLTQEYGEAVEEFLAKEGDWQEHSSHGTTKMATKLQQIRGQILSMYEGAMPAEMVMPVQKPDGTWDLMVNYKPTSGCGTCLTTALFERMKSLWENSLRMTPEKNIRAARTKLSRHGRYIRKMLFKATNAAKALHAEFPTLWHQELLGFRAEAGLADKSKQAVKDLFMESWNLGSEQFEEGWALTGEAARGMTKLMTSVRKSAGPILLSAGVPKSQVDHILRNWIKDYFPHNIIALPDADPTLEKKERTLVNSLLGIQNHLKELAKQPQTESTDNLRKELIEAYVEALKTGKAPHPLIYHKAERFMADVLGEHSRVPRGRQRSRSTKHRAFDSLQLVDIRNVFGDLNRAGRLPKTIEVEINGISALSRYLLEFGRMLDNRVTFWELENNAQGFDTRKENLNDAFVDGNYAYSQITLQTLEDQIGHSSDKWLRDTLKTQKQNPGHRHVQLLDKVRDSYINSHKDNLELYRELGDLPLDVMGERGAQLQRWLQSEGHLTDLDIGIARYHAIKAADAKYYLAVMRDRRLPEETRVRMETETRVIREETEKAGIPLLDELKLPPLLSGEKRKGPFLEEYTPPVLDEATPLTEEASIAVNVIRKGFLSQIASTGIKNLLKPFGQLIEGSGKYTRIGKLDPQQFGFPSTEMYIFKQLKPLYETLFVTPDYAKNTFFRHTLKIAHAVKRMVMFNPLFHGINLSINMISQIPLNNLKGLTQDDISAMKEYVRDVHGPRNGWTEKEIKQFEATTLPDFRMIFDSFRSDKPGKFSGMDYGKEIPINLEHPIFQFMMDFGVQLGASSDVGGIEHVTPEALGLERTPGQRVVDFGTDWLFNRLSPAIEADIFYRNFAQSLKDVKRRNPGIDQRRATKIAGQIAERMVTNFSGKLNKLDLNQFMNHAGRVLMFANHWTMSNARILYSMMGMGGNFTDYDKGGATLMSLSASSVARWIFYKWFMAQGLNMVATGQPTWENEPDKRGHVAFWRGRDDVGKPLTYYVDMNRFAGDVWNWARPSALSGGALGYLLTNGLPINGFGIVARAVGTAAGIYAGNRTGRATDRFISKWANLNQVNQHTFPQAELLFRKLSPVIKAPLALIMNINAWTAEKIVDDIMSPDQQLTATAETIVTELTPLRGRWVFEGGEWASMWKNASTLTPYWTATSLGFWVSKGRSIKSYQARLSELNRRWYRTRKKILGMGLNRSQKANKVKFEYDEYLLEKRRLLSDYREFQDSYANQRQAQGLNVDWGTWRNKGRFPIP